jgi:hypothetical protein
LLVELLSKTCWLPENTCHKAAFSAGVSIIPLVTVIGVAPVICPFDPNCPPIRMVPELAAVTDAWVLDRLRSGPFELKEPNADIGLVRADRTGAVVWEVSAAIALNGANCDVNSKKQAVPARAACSNKTLLCIFHVVPMQISHSVSTGKRKWKV